MTIVLRGSARPPPGTPATAAEAGAPVDGMVGGGVVGAGFTGAGAPPSERPHEPQKPTLAGMCAPQSGQNAIVSITLPTTTPR